MEGISMKLPEANERERVSNMIQVGNAILLDREHQIDGGANEQDLYQDIGKKLQQSYLGFYEKSGIQDSISELREVERSDDEALRLVTERANSGEGGWAATFPNLGTEGKGMDCTLASAMLHAGLEELGYRGVRSTLRQGHYVVTRLMEDGSVKIYDPATRVTSDGVTSGYSRIFKPEEVIVTDVDEGKGQVGKRIEITVDSQDLPGGFGEPSADGGYRQVLYGSPQGTYLDLSVALENIDSLRRDAESSGVQGRDSEEEPEVWRQQARQIVEDNPAILHFDYQALKDEIDFFDPHDSIK